jgi:hypothetical protein
MKILVKPPFLIVMAASMLGSFLPEHGDARKRKKIEIQEEEIEDYEYPYGMAGCGIGSLVIEKNESGA